MPRLEQALQRGIAYLRTTQAADGSFTGHSSPTVQPFTVAYSYRTTFLPALILAALCDIDAAQSVRQPLAAWVSAQRSPAGSFNYWARDAPQRQTMPYPDDLDDTFCALIALYRHNPALVDAGMLGAAIKVLLAAEQQVGGPYRTWLVGPDAPPQWQDVDIAVNCNIAYFLRLVAKPLPNLTAYMDQAITGRTFTSPYYPSAMPVLYYMARAYQGEQTERLAACIQEQQTVNPLEAALRICALARLGKRSGLRSAVTALMQHQQADGAWPEGAFCLDASRKGHMFYHGSPTLTTAFALEALQAFTAQPVLTAYRRQTTKTYASIIAAAHKTITSLDNDLQAQADVMISRMTDSDVSQEIVLMPQFFDASLLQPSGLSATVLQQLSLANLFGWMAYTIYDDFLDGEGQPTLLSVANVAMRTSLDAFATALPDERFQAFVRQAFNTIDGANAWEVKHGRFTVHGERAIIPVLPQYGNLHQLAKRSFGHLLTPLAILTAAGLPPHDPKMTQIKTGLQHYLIARQLQDDLHDWEDDFRAGRMTAVVAEILRSARIQPGDYRLAELLPRMQRQFWQLVLLTACTRTARHVTMARTTLHASGLLRPDGRFYALLDRLETIMHQTRAEQSKAADFLAAYKKPLA